MPEARDDEPDNAYATEWDRFSAWIGIRENRLADTPARPTDNLIVHGVISDLHMPFHCLDAIMEAVDWLVLQGVSELWLGGDVVDHYGLSRFSQYESVPIQHEAIECRKIIDMLSLKFALVHIISGNHEARERKYLASRLPADLLQWFLDRSFIERITEDMENVRVERRVVENTALHWITPVGKDAIIAHAETASKITLRAVENVRQWIDGWHGVLDLARPRVIFQAHTHNAGVARVGPQLVCELGCTCKIQSYALEPRLYPKPQCKAATVFTQIDGVTDLNSVRQYYLGLA